MRFYNHQHEFYCGIDLHARTMHVCVVDHAGKKLLHKNLPTRPQHRWLDEISSWRTRNLVVGCESTFSWYWLADLCRAEKIPFVLGHALYLKAIHGGKTKSDAIDSEKLAMLLRGGNFPVSFVYPRELRAARDLMRRRTFLVRRRAEILGHTQLVNLQQNRPDFDKRLCYRRNREGVAESFEEADLRAIIEVNMELLDKYDSLIGRLELFIERHAKVHAPQDFYRLQSIPGVGRVLAMTMLYEIHNISRFPRAGDFLSYCRLVKGSHSSAGKRVGSPGKKIGNRHLKWAFSEAVPLLKRECAPAAKFAARIEKKHGKPRANTLLAIKLGRAVFHMLRRQEAFDPKTFANN